MEGNANEPVSWKDGQCDFAMLLDKLGPNDLVEAVCKNLQEQLIGTIESQNDKKMRAKSFISDSVYSNTSLRLPAISSAIKVDGSRSTFSTGNDGEVMPSATTTSRDDNNPNEATIEQEIYPSPVISKSHILVKDKPIKVALGHHDCCGSDGKHFVSKKRNESLPSCDQFQPKQLHKLNGGSEEEKSKHSTLISESIDHRWMSKYIELLEYKRKNGHTNVPQKYPPNPQLGTWVYEQRRKFKKKKLPSERMNLLSKICFVWNRNELIWRQHFLKVVEYKQVHGHTNVPCRYKKDRKLATWVRSQRMNYRRFRRGEQSGMTIQRLEALNALGFEWDLNDTGNSSSVGLAVDQ